MPEGLKVDVNVTLEKEDIDHLVRQLSIASILVGICLAMLVAVTKKVM